ncbi:helix-turn-helix domain-containing protein [Actinokineospora globicatena]|uniref:helix-turn-helix domain-containing protein n=1 Tax=Actinokineospora globicatena TaxID=103729 RepID=UPI0020A449A4|nr:XRE family transcriptional regulator [Actinokineospora globicatena]MCP2303213.1 Transcriptional regulator, contains XRE-family HTH domain [Actinokineospora globicatena]GLW79664.1 hypothetical protein Aglo01_41450 [Actinokineospora globicatena]GLW85926.1 hypothetical protein Aglo02_35660 [Actinokineospora globicatena]
MPDDWDAVSAAVNHRMRELRMTQAELVRQSGLSKALVQEIRHNLVQRRRSTRTLEALSTALELPALYLTNVLTGGPLPHIAPPAEADDDPIAERLDALEQLLATLVLRVDRVLARHPRLNPHANTRKPPHAQPPRPQPRPHTPHLDPRS